MDFLIFPGNRDDIAPGSVSEYIANSERMVVHCCLVSGCFGKYIPLGPWDLPWVQPLRLPLGFAYGNLSGLGVQNSLPRDIWQSYRVFLEDRERGKRCVMLKQAKVGSKKLRDLSCVDKPLPGGAQGCALLQLRWVLETRLCQGRGQGLEVGDKHVMEDLS